MPSARILAIAPGDPLDPATFSGISRRLLCALDAQGALAAAVDGRPAALVRAEQAASFDRDGVRWRQHYNAGASPLSPAIRRAMSALAGARARRAARTAEPDAWLQMTGWFLPRPAQDRPVRASFHDGNLATFLGRPDLRIARDSKRVARALAHERRLYDAMDVLFPMSEWLGRSFVEDFGQDPAKVVAVGGGPNFDDLPEVPARAWDRPRPLFVGKDWERKGGPAVLGAFARLRARHPAAELTVVGPERLPVPEPDGVRFVGRLAAGDPRLKEAFATATALVMPSVYEPFGIAFLEGMAYGLPCLGGDTCAMPEIIADGETGFVVPAADAGLLGARLTELADDPARAERLGAAGRARLEARYTWDAVATRIVNEVAARSKDRTPAPIT